MLVVSQNQADKGHCLVGLKAEFDGHVRLSSESHFDHEGKFSVLDHKFLVKPAHRDRLALVFVIKTDD